MAVLHEQLLGGMAALRQRGLEPLRYRRAQLAFAAGVFLGKLCKLSRDRIRVDQCGRLVGGREHGSRIPERRVGVTPSAAAASGSNIGAEEK